MGDRARGPSAFRQGAARDAPALDGLVVGEERAMPVECAAESGHFNAPNPRRRRWPLPTWEEV